MGESQEAEPVAAASVILLHETDAGVQIYLLRRHRKASFMSSSYVFPGGIAEEGEEDDRITAGREPFEESGVLLAAQDGSAQERERWRHALNIERAGFAEVMGDTSIDVGALTYYSHWVTPSFESRRYSAKFCLAVMPEGQTALRATSASRFVLSSEQGWIHR
ncbi:MAG: NUDIX domain-containing protein [Myxococcales bacterium]|nr:NUDIX domain-containing protein [Myxococcales bacterium]